MEKNKFIIDPATSINSFVVASGHATIDCNHETVYSALKDSSSNYDRTFNKPILKSEMVYLPEFPSDCITYEQLLEYGKDKYYWDALDQRLFKFIVRGEVRPFIKQHQVIIGTEGNPTQAVDTLREFSKVDGTFTEVQLDIPTSNYIAVKGHPEQYAERPYTEEMYYYDTVNKKYYKFKSFYTQNKNNWYYDNTLENGTVLQYLYDLGAWSTRNDALILDTNPNDVIPVDETNIDDINKTICYCDRSTDTLYYFDFGQYFMRITYTGTIYERPFEFYRKLQDVFLDINSEEKVNTKKIYYIAGHPRKVKEPNEDRYYYDTKGQKYYEYSSTAEEWTEVPQENILIPQTFFPHTHGDIQKKVTLAFYGITDCYTKKEVDKKMPVIPGYVSAFENDMGYIFKHQDISGKQDKLSDEEINTLNSGISATLVNKYDNYYTLLINKADKATTLRGYGIKDAYTYNELEGAIGNLINMLDGTALMKLEDELG